MNGCSSLKEVIVPDSVVEMGESAFRDCSNLENMRLSNNITIIQPFAIGGCNKLPTINIPVNCTTIAAQAFRGCTNLNNIYIPKNVTKIYGSSFESCENLTNIDISEKNEIYELDSEQNGIIYEKQNDEINSLILLAPMKKQVTVKIKEGVKIIEAGTFSICTNMEKIELPSSLRNISGGAFRGLGAIGKLKDIEFPNGNDVYKSEDGYLYSKDEKKLIYVAPAKTQIVIKETVQSIGTQAIDNNNITSLIIPDNVITVNSGIFNEASNLKTIYIGSGVENLESTFMGGVSSITEIVIDSNNLNYKVEGNFILTKNGKEVVTAISKRVQSLVIPEGVEKLQDNSLARCKATKLKLPSTLKVIGSSAISYWNNITTVDIPSSVETIENNAFNSCSNLTEVRIDKEEGSITGSPWSVPKGEKAIIWLR